MVNFSGQRYGPFSMSHAACTGIVGKLEAVRGGQRTVAISQARKPYNTGAAMSRALTYLQSISSSTFFNVQ